MNRKTPRKVEFRKHGVTVDGYGKPRKIEVYYIDAFDLARQCLEGLGEGNEE